MPEKPYTRSDLSPEEIKQCDELAEFTISFIQAFIKTGYYSPDHPGAVKAISGLFSSFSRIIRGKGEITFLAREAGEEKEILVDAVFKEPFSLRQLLKREMGEAYIVKFSEYFERKKLISFSLKNNITKDEFNKFIELMSAAPSVQEETDLVEELNSALIENNIIHISTIFDQDLVSSKARKLPWRVEMVLTRLRKDLRMVPLYKNLTLAELQKVKRQVFSDIIRPVRKAEILREILVNSDLITQEVKEIKGAGKTSLEDDLIEQIPREFIVQIVFQLVDEIEVGETKKDLPVRYNMVMTITRKTIPRLYELVDQEELILFRRLFNLRLLSFEELPVQLKEIITLEKLTESFLKDTKGYLERLDRINSAAAYQEISEVLIKIVPELMRRGKYKELEYLISVLSKHKKINLASFRERSKYAANALEKIINKETIKYLVEHFQPKEGSGTELFALIAEFGESTLSLLFGFVQDEDRDIRMNACNILSRMGKKVLNPLIKMIKEPSLNWMVIRNLLLVLGDIGIKEEEILGILKEKLRHHSYFRVREEALFSLYKILGKESETYLILALKDKDIHVAERACNCLALIKSKREELISYLLDNLKKSWKPLETYFSRKKSRLYTNTLRIEEKIELDSCRILRNMAEYLGEKQEKEIEAMLLKALKKKRGITKIIFFSRADKLFRVRVEICKILAQMGGKKSLPVLKKVIAEREPFLQHAAQVAFKKIAERVKGGENREQRS